LLGDGSGGFSAVTDRQAHRVHRKPFPSFQEVLFRLEMVAQLSVVRRSATANPDNMSSCAGRQRLVPT
jgi:hypothetical protein